MRFENLDLNLLVAFDALLKERNVSGAARRLHLSQSAMSGTLARLRDYFQDDLLVMAGRGMVPTARASELQRPVAEALMLIRSSIITPASFDPASSDRCFTIVASDYVYDVFLAETLRGLTAEAPGIVFDIGAPSVDLQDQFDGGEIDLMITLTTHLSDDHPTEELFSDNITVICWAENDRCRNGVSAEVFLESPHVVPVFGPNRAPAYSELILDQLGLARRLSMRVPTFGAMPLAIVGTNRLGTMNRRHADHFARTLPIKVLPLPFEAPALVEAMQWHRARSNDCGLRWLTDKIRHQIRAAGL